MHTSCSLRKRRRYSPVMQQGHLRHRVARSNSPMGSGLLRSVVWRSRILGRAHIEHCSMYRPQDASKLLLRLVRCKLQGLRPKEIHIGSHAEVYLLCMNSEYVHRVTIPANSYLKTTV